MTQQVRDSALPSAAHRPPVVEDATNINCRQNILHFCDCKHDGVQSVWCVVCLRDCPLAQCEVLLQRQKAGRPNPPPLDSGTISAPNLQAKS
ncbi:hypothetical protein WMY93_022316 [Mugilogobius chulae]|uniref:Uncharacterized protein n=1 Tax=Mugilogobius chulae TaxID=88201 RepID=A0AAW0NIY3_9GOBI